MIDLVGLFSRAPKDPAFKENEKNIITVPKDIADKARLAIDRMLAIS